MLKKRGFTLIELLVVIAIIAILAVVVLVALNAARTKARGSRAQSDLASLSPALEMCRDDTGGVYPNGVGYAGLSAFDCGDSNFSVYATPPTAPGGVTYTYCSTNGSNFHLRATGTLDAQRDVGSDACVPA